MIQEIVSRVADKSERVTGEAQAVQKFGRFFTGYMGTASLVTAALPIPVRSLHLIPAFASQENFTNTYTSMSCFLVFAYVFYIRHTLARWMFARRGEHFAVRFWVSLLPVLFLCCSIGCAIAYHHELGDALDALAAAGARLPSSVLLSKINDRAIPGAGSMSAASLSTV